MTDKEFRRLSRAQLIEIIYELQLQNDELIKENQSLENALSDKRLHIEKAGNLAEAVLTINNCFQSAQNAAEQYLNEIKLMHEETKAEKDKILEKARTEAFEIVSAAQNKQEGCFVATDNNLKQIGLEDYNNE